jgi:uncharacterized membrane protein
VTPYLRNPMTYTWAFLAIATLIGLLLGHDADAHQGSTWITAAILLIAVVKTRLVMRRFMEVRSAATWLKWACDTWLVYLFAMVLYLYGKNF